MPNVTAPTRNDQNGQSSTYFLDSVSTTSTTYTYPAQQDALTVTNKGSFPITLTVNGTAYTIQGSGVQSVAQLFTSFTIVATGQTAFDALAISETTNNVQQTGSNGKKAEVDNNNNLQVNPAPSDKSFDSITSWETGYGTVVAGAVTSATAATAYQVSAGQVCRRVIIKAKKANTGIIYVGGSNVSSTAGFELSAGDQVILPVSDLMLLYITSTVNGEGVTFIAFN